MKKMQSPDKIYGRKRGERGRGHGRAIAANKRIANRAERRERKRVKPENQGQIEKHAHWGYET